MRRPIILFLLLPCLLNASATVNAAPQAVSLKSLLQEMIDRDRAARWPSPEYKSSQASSCDRRSKTPADPEGWFANNDWSQFIRSEVNSGRREWVMMDAEGPGCVTRIWRGGATPPKTGRVRFYFDGSDTPAIVAPAYELLVGPALVGHPLAIENAQGAGGSPGGMNLFLPIPYAHHCKMTWDDINPHDPLAPPESRWYNIEYCTYAAGTRVETFTMDALQKEKALIDTVQATLSTAPPETRGHEVARDFQLTPGGQWAVTLPKGPAAVREFELQIKPQQPDGLEQALRSTIIRMNVDGEETVWCPAGDFFGSGVGLNSLQNWHRTVLKDGRMTCRWVMPYHHTATLTLHNLGSSVESAHMRLRTDRWKWDDRTMLFHANWRCQNDLPTRPRSDWNYLSADGQGVYLGDALTVYNPVPDWWGEGDEKVWVDHESIPSHFGTGSEDYYSYSWGDTHLFQGPFSSQVRCDGPGNKGYTVVTRTRDLDGIPFRQHLQFDMEIWHWADCKVDYAVATYWYARPGAAHNRLPQPAEATRTVSKVIRVPGAIEAETMEVAGKSPGLTLETQRGALPNGSWSGDAQLFFRGTRVGDFVELVIPVADNAPKKVTLYGTKSWDYGIIRFSLNGKPTGQEFDAFSATPVASGPIDLGECTPVNGRILLRAEVTGANPAARGTKAYFGMDYVTVSNAG